MVECFDTHETKEPKSIDFQRKKLFNQLKVDFHTFAQVHLEFWICFFKFDFARPHRPNKRFVQQIKTFF